MTEVPGSMSKEEQDWERRDATSGGGDPSIFLRGAGTRRYRAPRHPSSSHSPIAEAGAEVPSPSIDGVEPSVDTGVQGQLPLVVETDERPDWTIPESTRQLGLAALARIRLEQADRQRLGRGTPPKTLPPTS